jgi:hypothetical protein
MCKPHFFDKKLPSKTGVRLIHGILCGFFLIEKLDPVKRKPLLCIPQWRPLVFETVILQAIAHAQRNQRITGILAYFDYMTAADTIDSRKSEDCDITDKLP